MMQDFCAPEELASAFAFEEADSDSAETPSPNSPNQQLDEGHDNEHAERDERSGEQNRSARHAEMLKHVKKWLQQADDSMEHSFAMYDILLTSMKSQFAHARESKTIGVEGKLTPFLSLTRTSAS